MIIQHLTLTFGLQTIFDDINLIIPENEKVGITGVNGAGKTTFFQVILKKIKPEEGDIKIPRNTRIAYLPQVITETISDEAETVLDYLLKARPIAKCNQKLNECYEALAEEKEEQKAKELLKKVTLLNEELDYWDQYNAETTLLKIVEGMNIEPELLDKKMIELSGGQKSKVAFTKLLYAKPDLILLDEPTNHLDKESRDYVIQFLKSYHGSVFVISHDIDFLNAVTTETLFIDKRNHKMKLYRGNYERFKKILESEEENLLRELQRQEKERERLRSIVLLYSNSSGKRKRMAQDREKKLEKLEQHKIELPPPPKKANLKLTSEKKSGLSVAKLKDITFAYPKKEGIIKELTFEIYRNERFLIVGPNGAGKSTLLKLIVGNLKPQKGTIAIGQNVEIAYYAQEHEGLELDKTILENFNEFPISENQKRAVLGNFLFYGEDIYKPIKVLSPGERSRVALAKLVLKKANFLILDEPTNHLDPETQSIIAETLRNYEGTILVVSHNPSFIHHMKVDRLLHLPEGSISYYDASIIKQWDEK